MPTTSKEYMAEYTAKSFHNYSSRRYTGRKGHYKKKGQMWLDISREEYQELLLTRTTCDCCNDFLPEYKDRCLDHDHTTGEFRGVLCNECNLAEGYLQSDPKRVAALLAYVNNNL